MKTINPDDLSIGDFVFLDSKNNSYKKGEYIFLRRTPFAIFGVKSNGGCYEFSSEVQFSLIDPLDTFVIAEKRTDFSTLDSILSAIEREIQDIRTGKAPRRFMVDAYSRMQINVTRLRTAFSKDKEHPPEAGSPSVEIPPKIVYVDSIPEIYRQGRWLVNNGVFSSIPTHASIDIHISGKN